MLDPATEVGVAVEKGVGDAGFTLDGLKGEVPDLIRTGPPK